MAFLIKNSNQQRTAGPTGAGEAVVSQSIHVKRGTLALPQSTTQQLFRVKGGRVLVKALLGTVTTIFQNSDPVLKVSSKALTAASVAIGTAVDIAATVDTTSAEVGSTIFVEGDGSAAILATAGATFIGANTGMWIAPQGEIYLTAGASKSGAAQWDLWYEPLDAGAYVEAVSVATAAI